MQTDKGIALLLRKGFSFFFKYPIYDKNMKINLLIGNYVLVLKSRLLKNSYLLNEIDIV